MEVGAVKQAFNNEIIQMKRNLNQAKIQIIHKLTRKAKTLAEKKAPENLKEKMKKKAESAVKEVLIIKKIKAKDIAKFTVTYDGELAKYLNKPEVDHNKACARLLLHKSLHQKHKHIRETFGNTSINDLFMSRLERRKMKKEAREKQKNKKKGKDEQKIVNVEGDWDVEELGNKGTDTDKTMVQDNGLISHDEPGSDDEPSSDDGGSCDNAIASDVEPSSDDKAVSDVEENNEALASDSDQSDDEIVNSVVANKSNDNPETNYVEIKNKRNNDISKHKKSKKLEKSRDESTIVNSDLNITNKFSKSTKHEKTPLNLPKDNKTKKDLNKNKNFNEKILKRKFNKVMDEKPSEEIKMADPFFMTTTGESYMSVVEPRQPDEIKAEHKQGNRQYRRAVMFGHVPKPRRDFKQDNRKFKDLANSNDRFNNKASFKNNKQFNVNSQTKDEEKVEKLHPSWEAKKRKSGILPFEGKKIVFDDGE